MKKISWVISGKDDCQNLLFLTPTGLLPIAAIDSPHHPSVTHDTEHNTDLFKRIWVSDPTRAKKFRSREEALVINKLLARQYGKYDAIAPTKVMDSEQAYSLFVGSKFAPQDDEEKTVVGKGLTKAQARLLKFFSKRRGFKKIWKSRIRTAK